MIEPRGGQRIVRLEKGRVGRAAEMMARAFFDDPFLRYMIPDPRKRSRRGPWFSGVGIRLGMLYGQARTTPDVEGISLWLPPSGQSISLLGMLRAGMLAVPFRVGLGTLIRLMRFMGRSEELRQRAVPGPHWHLFILAVDPACQGRGLGLALLRPGLEQADRQGLPSYLETTNPDNAAYYGRHGFRPAGETGVPGGPRVWGLLRPPA